MSDPKRPNIELQHVSTEQKELPVRIEINTMQALGLLGTVQLALRHPRFPRQQTGIWARRFAQDLQGQIVKNAPGLAFICDAGWQKDFDR